MFNSKTYITNSTESYLKTPPKYIEEALVKKYKDFQIMLQAFGGGAGSSQAAMELSRKIIDSNSYSKLSKQNLGSHTGVHWGYYEEIDKSGAVMVKDHLTDKLIQKQQAVLTTGGYFISETSPNLLHLDIERSSSAAKNAFDLIRLLLPEMFDEDKDADDIRARMFKIPRYIYLNSIGLWHEVDLECLSVRIHFETLGSLFRRISTHYIQRMPDFNTVFQDGSGFTEDIFNSIYKRVFNIQNNGEFSSTDYLKHFELVVKSSSKDHVVYTHTFPKDVKYFQGLSIRFSNAEQHLSFNNSVSSEERNVPFIDLSYSDSKNRGAVYINSTSESFWRKHKMLHLDLGILKDCPIRFVIQTIKVTPLTKSLRTANNDGTIMGYHTKIPDYKASFLMSEKEKEFYKVNKTMKPAFFGIELEHIIKKSKIKPVDRQSLCAKEVKRIADCGLGDHAVLKSDSSIKDVGFEIVTIPATLAYHKEVFDAHFFEYDKVKASYRCKYEIMASENCGMHVHIGKEAFLPDKINFNKELTAQEMHQAFKVRIGKFITFLNSPDNASFLYDISGRIPNVYCMPNPIREKNKFGVNNGITIGRAMSVNDGFSGYERRSIVNTQNAATVEIRIFKSTTDRHTLYRRLEFCHALVEFVKVCTPRELTIYHFVTWLADPKNTNRKQYTSLLHWLYNRKLIGLSKKKSSKTNKMIKVYGPCLIPEPPPIDMTKVKGNSWEGRDLNPKYSGKKAPVQAKKAPSKDPWLDVAMESLSRPPGSRFFTTSPT